VKKQPKKKPANRKVIVFVCLAGTLSLTSALLLALAPAPLAPDSTTSLFAIDAPSSLDALFDTAQPVAAGRWKYIYIHHSHTTAGSATSLSHGHGMGDHFVIGNGDGCLDGEIQITQRWAEQESISDPPPGVSRIDPACVSICLVGDLDQTSPTPTQFHRLTQLVSALQMHLHVPANQVWLVDQPGSSAGVGTKFPKNEFRTAILP
jgi:hypothetical protein